MCDAKGQESHEVLAVFWQMLEQSPQQGLSPANSCWSAQITHPGSYTHASRSASGVVWSLVPCQFIFQIITKNALLNSSHLKVNALPTQTARAQVWSAKTLKFTVHVFVTHVCLQNTRFKQGFSSQLASQQRRRFSFYWQYSFIIMTRWSLMPPLAQPLNLFSLSAGNWIPLFFSLPPRHVFVLLKKNPKKNNSQRKHPGSAERQGQHQRQRWCTEATAAAAGHQGAGTSQLYPSKGWVSFKYDTRNKVPLKWSRYH